LSTPSLLHATLFLKQLIDGLLQIKGSSGLAFDFAGYSRTLSSASALYAFIKNSLLSGSGTYYAELLPIQARLHSKLTCRASLVAPQQSVLTVLCALIAGKTGLLIR